MTPETFCSPAVLADSILTVYRNVPASLKQMLAVSFVLSWAVSLDVIHPPKLLLHDTCLSDTGSIKMTRTGAPLLLTHRTSSPGLTVISPDARLSPIITSFTSPVLVTVGMPWQPNTRTPARLRYRIGFIEALLCNKVTTFTHNTVIIGGELLTPE